MLIINLLYMIVLLIYLSLWYLLACLKGGILVSLEVDGTKLAFVSCHLTAHEVFYKYCAS